MRQKSNAMAVLVLRSDLKQQPRQSYRRGVYACGGVVGAALEQQHNLESHV